MAALTLALVLAIWAYPAELVGERIRDEWVAFKAKHVRTVRQCETQLELV